MYELIHANCIDTLRHMPDKAIDCIVTDPPYGVGINFGAYEDNVENLKHLIDSALPEMRRIAKRTVITCGHRNLHLYPQATWILGWFYGSARLCSWGFNHWQPVLVYGADPLRPLHMMHSDVIRSQSTSLADRTDHPTPKPLSFARKLINRVAPSPADVILDPFVGSGTTGVAAIQLGHKFIGIELNGDYLAIAKRRIAEARPDFHQTIELVAERGEIRRV